MNINLFLFHINKHVSLNEEEQQELISLTHIKKVNRNEYLLREGEVSRCISFVLEGCLKIYHANIDGQEHIIDFCIEEWWADDLHSLLTQLPSTYYIKAIENTLLVQISKQKLEVLYTKIPKLERFFRILFQNAYIAQREQINQTISRSAKERYLLFLQKKPYAIHRFSQKDIASYLGVTPQFFSALKKSCEVNVD
jgi:CRP-like cAMP-binding protein